MSREMEHRITGGDVRARKSEDGPTILEGYGAVFNRETVIAGLFREVIMPSAFDDVLTNDVRGAFNHDPNVILSRTTNGTLRLSTDATGLRYEMDLNLADPDAVRVAAKVARGDVDQSSFSFTLSDDGDEWDYSETKTGKLPLRRILRIDELYDTGPVAFAAYPQTSVSARARDMASRVDQQALAAEESARTRLDMRRRRSDCAEAE